MPSGKSKKQLKAGYEFEDGKVFRPASIDDIRAEDVKMDSLPEWIKMRAHKNGTGKETAMGERERIESILANLKKSAALAKSSRNLLKNTQDAEVAQAIGN